MEKSTSQVLLERGRSSRGTGRTFGLSLVVHASLLALVFLAPEHWGRQHLDLAPSAIMTISLGGAQGPDTGGLSPLGARPVQEAIPLPPSPRPRAIRVPAREEPEMTVPAPTARRREVTPPPVEQSPPEARGRTPTEGEEVRAGNALANTGTQGLGFGLSTGGGGSGAYLDVANFCCPDYLATMSALIRRNWDPNQRVAGSVMIQFQIQRDGTLTDIQVQNSSGYIALDMAAQRAVLVTRQMPPLPSAFTAPNLGVHINFQYRN
jgi:TonB family protein